MAKVESGTEARRITCERLELDTPGHHPVDVPIICVITRFGLRSPRHLLPTYLGYRRVVRQAKATKTPGLLRSAFLIENLTTCYSVSLWANGDAVPRLGTNVPAHVEAARQMFGRLAYRKGRGPELWSTRWLLTTVSNNLNWQDFDLRALIAEHEGSAESSAGRA